MIKITATDLKANLGKYLDLVDREDIHITKNGTDVAVLSAPKAKHSWVDDITGVIPWNGEDTDIKKFKSERLAKKHESLD